MKRLFLSLVTVFTVLFGVCTPVFAEEGLPEEAYLSYEERVAQNTAEHESHYNNTTMCYIVPIFMIGVVVLGVVMLPASFASARHRAEVKREAEFVAHQKYVEAMEKSKKTSATSTETSKAPKASRVSKPQSQYYMSEDEAALAAQLAQKLMNKAEQKDSSSALRDSI